MRLLTRRAVWLWAIAAGILLVGALWTIRQPDPTGNADPPVKPGASARPAQVSPDSLQPPPNHPVQRSPAPHPTLAEAQRGVIEAKKEYEAARAEVAAAEADMADVERQVEALERFVQDLEDRGEDPAEHAEEGMELFNPTFDAYRRAVARAELADAGEREAATRLQRAEDALKDVRSRLEDEATP